MAKLNWEKANRRQNFEKAQRWNLAKDAKNMRLISRLFDAQQAVNSLQESKRKFWENKRFDLQEKKKCNHENYKRFFAKDAKIVCRYCNKSIQ